MTDTDPPGSDDTADDTVTFDITASGYKYITSVTADGIHSSRFDDNTFVRPLFQLIPDRPDRGCAYHHITEGGPIDTRHWIRYGEVVTTNGTDLDDLAAARAARAALDDLAAARAANLPATD